MPRSLVIAVGLALLACDRRAPPEPIDPALVKISTDRVVRHGDVGHDQWERPATYVIVDADNAAQVDLVVTLGGALTDAAGASIAPLRPESLRLPAGARRTFVLIDARDTARPEATGATVEVRGVMAATWQPTAHLSDGYLHDDHGKAMVSASLTNDADRPGKLIVFGAFHDADGRPMQRQYLVAELGPQITQVVRFVGPPGSTKGVIFLGDASY